MEAVIGTPEALGEEGASSCFRRMLSGLAKHLGVTPEVVQIMLMSVGCFLDAISDVIFQLSLINNVYLELQDASGSQHPLNNNAILCEGTN